MERKNYLELKWKSNRKLIMNFKGVYDEVFAMFPERIDLSDGKLVMTVDGEGFLSPNFNRICEIAEDKASLKEEWYSLFVWIMSQVLHEKAQEAFGQGIFEMDHTIDEKRFREFLIRNLQQDGYEDMMNEFLAYEKN